MNSQPVVSTQPPLLEVRGVSDERLGPLSFEAGLGLTCVVVEADSARARLAEILSGVRCPRRGEVRLDGERLFATPRARARVASLLAHEEFLPAPNVRLALELALNVGGQPAELDPALAALELSELSLCQEDALTEAERRALAFALVFSQKQARLAVLCEAFALTPRIASVRELCVRLSAERCVIALCRSLGEAVWLGGRALVLTGGRLTPFSASRAPGARLWVRSAHARRLSESISQRAADIDVRFDAGRSEFEFWLAGAELSLLARHVVEVALEQGCAVEALRSLSADQEELHLRTLWDSGRPRWR